MEYKRLEKLIGSLKDIKASYDWTMKEAMDMCDVIAILEALRDQGSLTAQEVEYEF